MLTRIVVCGVRECVTNSVRHFFVRYLFVLDPLRSRACFSDGLPEEETQSVNWLQPRQSRGPEISARETFVEILIGAK